MDKIRRPAPLKTLFHRKQQGEQSGQQSGQQSDNNSGQASNTGAADSGRRGQGQQQKFGDGGNQSQEQERQNQLLNLNLTSNLQQNQEILRELFKHCSDIVFRVVPPSGKHSLLLIYVDGLVDTKVLDNVVLRPWIYDGLPQGLAKANSVAQVIEQQFVAIAQVKKLSKVKEIVESIVKANVAVLADGSPDALLADLKGFDKRGVEEPAAEIAVRGPREGFTETLRINTTLLRRKVQSHRLKMESFTLGSVSHNDVVLAYIEGIAPDSIVSEVRKRVGRIEIDGVLGSGYVEEFIEDAPFSPFPQIQNTERPDVVAASLLEGKIAVFVDGSPFVLILPMVFWSALQAAEDYYERFMYTTFVRLIRMALLNVSLLLPSLYVAVTTFHPQLIPTTLLISIVASREGVPFPAVVEALAMEFTFEALREAGIRLPKPVGSAVSIVGALVIGQAAVQAGIVSAPMVIIVATTGIASFAIPRYNMGTAYRMLRFVMLISAGMFGLYGIAMVSIAILIHLVNLRSFGVPYLAPVAPQILGNLKDVFIRFPRWSMHHRPVLSSGGNKRRIPEGQKPRPNRG